MSDIDSNNHEFQEFLRKYQKVPVVEYPNNVATAVGVPVVSCRISTYQHGPYIRQCIEGMLMQKTDFPFEIVIGEDESSDGTREICIEYAEANPDKIRLFLHDRRNNIAINNRPTGKFQGNYTKFMCRGEYIAVCEGDDFWIDSLKLQRQVDHLRAHPRENICGMRALVWYGSGYSYINPRPKENVVRLKDILWGNNSVCTATLVYRKDDYEHSTSWSANVIAGDWCRLVYSMNNGSCCRVLPVVGAVYRVHAGGVWSGKKWSKMDFAQMKLARLNAFLGVAGKEAKVMVGEAMIYFEWLEKFHTKGLVCKGKALFVDISIHPVVILKVFMFRSKLKLCYLFRYILSEMHRS